MINVAAGINYRSNYILQREQRSLCKQNGKETREKEEATNNAPVLITNMKHFHARRYLKRQCNYM